MRTFIRLLHDEEGQDLVEYALLASLIAIVAVAALRLLGTTVASFYTKVGSAF